MTLRLLAALCVLISALWIGAGVVLGQGDDPAVYDPAPEVVCPHAAVTTEYLHTIITRRDGVRFIAQHVTADDLAEWDVYNTVKIGGVVRIPYAQVLLIDPRCA